MLLHSRNCCLDICDLDGNKVCPIYDSNAEITSFASDVYVTTQRNGWKTINFNLSSSDDENENFIVSYIKPEYKIRLITTEGSTTTTDWFILDNPKINHSAFSKTITVSADHASSILKYRRLDLEFSTEKLNNVGTAQELLITILQGTGWNVGSVSTFYENFKDEVGNLIVKKRSFVCASNTGAFNMISKMCDLFEAKARYYYAIDPTDNIEKPYVDILPMNPFNEDSINPTTGLPDLTNASNILEMDYGINVKGISKTENSENITTKLTVYGTYGDAEKGFCGISELTHNKYTGTVSTTDANNKYYITITNPFDATLTYVNFQSNRINANNVIEFSCLDKTSMLYVYNVTRAEAYHCTLSSGHEGTSITTTVSSEKNWVSYITDFHYYNDSGLLSETQFQALAAYQRNTAAYMKDAYNAAINFANDYQDTTLLVGTVNYVKLKVNRYDSTNKILYLDTTNYNDGVIYRTDYNEPEANWFEWKTADSLKPNGEAVNPEASIIYAFKYGGTGNALTLKTTSYIKTITRASSQYGNLQLYLWDSVSLYPESAPDPLTNYVYLFSSNSISGTLGAMEVAQLANHDAADAYPSTDTAHHVYWKRSSQSTPAVQQNTYCWLISIEDPGTTGIHVKFKDTPDTTWQNCKLDDESYYVNPKYWYKSKEARLYVLSENNYVLWFNPETDTSDSRYTEKKNILDKFAKLMLYIDNERVYEQGLYDSYIYTAGQEGIPQGYYYFDDGYNNYHLFHIDSNSSSQYNGARLIYDTKQTYVIMNNPIATSVNIFSNVTWTSGNIDYTGVVFNSSTRQYCSDISCGQNIAFQLLNMNGCVMHWYNASGLHLRQDKITSASMYISSPANTTYLKVVRPNNQAITAYKSALASYTYKTISAKSYNSAITKNKSNELSSVTWINGTLNPSDHKTIIADQEHKTSTYFRVYPNIQYYALLTNQASGSTATISFFDKNNNYINGQSFLPSSSASYVTFTSSNIYYARVQIYGSLSNTVDLHINNYDSYISLDNIQYKKLTPWVAAGQSNAICDLSRRFVESSDATYGADRTAVTNAAAAIAGLENTIIAALGNMYKASTWQDSNYVEGDEKRLFNDAVDKLEVAAEPTTEFDIQFLDLYSSNYDEYVNWPDIDIDTAIHLIDDKMNINRWAFVEEIKKCYDSPWKTTLKINTNLRTANNKTFTDVISSFADVSAAVQAHDGIVQQASTLIGSAGLLAEKIQGSIDTARNAINGSVSNWYTDKFGNIIFESIAGNSAMKLSGEGLAIANRKNEYGDWEWSTFGTGDGFDADLINAGTIRANLIEAGSITADKISSTFGSDLDISSNQTLNLFATVDGSKPAGALTTPGSSISISAENGIDIGSDTSVDIESANVNIKGGTISIGATTAETPEAAEIEIISTGTINLNGDSSITIGSGNNNYVKIDSDDGIDIRGENFTAIVDNENGEIFIGNDVNDNSNHFSIYENGSGDIVTEISGSILNIKTSNPDGENAKPGIIYLGNESNYINSNGVLQLSAGNGKTITINPNSGTTGAMTSTIPFTLSNQGTSVALTPNSLTLTGANMCLNSSSNLTVNSGNINMESGTNINVASGGNINIASGGHFVITSTNFNIDQQGNVSMKGNVTANSGKIGGWYIDAGASNTPEKFALVSGTTVEGTGGYSSVVGLSHNDLNPNEIEDYNPTKSYAENDLVKVNLRDSSGTTNRIFRSKLPNNQGHDPKISTNSSWWKPAYETIAIWAGAKNPIDAPFKVYRDGSIEVKSIETVKNGNRRVADMSDSDTYPVSLSVDPETDTATGNVTLDFSLSMNKGDPITTSVTFSKGGGKAYVSPSSTVGSGASIEVRPGSQATATDTVTVSAPVLNTVTWTDGRSSSATIKLRLASQYSHGTTSDATLCLGQASISIGTRKSYPTQSGNDVTFKVIGGPIDTVIAQETTSITVVPDRSVDWNAATSTYPARGSIGYTVKADGNELYSNSITINADEIYSRGMTAGGAGRIVWNPANLSLTGDITTISVSGEDGTFSMSQETTYTNGTEVLSEHGTATMEGTNTIEASTVHVGTLDDRGKLRYEITSKINGVPTASALTDWINIDDYITDKNGYKIDCIFGGSSSSDNCIRNTAVLTHEDGVYILMKDIDVYVYDVHLFEVDEGASTNNIGVGMRLVGPQNSEIYSTTVDLPQEYIDYNQSVGIASAYGALANDKTSYTATGPQSGDSVTISETNYYYINLPGYAKTDNKKTITGDITASLEAGTVNVSNFKEYNNVVVPCTVTYGSNPSYISTIKRTVDCSAIWQKGYDKGLEQTGIQLTVDETTSSNSFTVEIHAGTQEVIKGYGLNFTSGSWSSTGYTGTAEIVGSDQEVKASLDINIAAPSESVQYELGVTEGMRLVTTGVVNSLTTDASGGTIEFTAKSKYGDAYLGSSVFNHATCDVNGNPTSFSSTNNTLHQPVKITCDNPNIVANKTLTINASDAVTYGLKTEAQNVYDTLSVSVDNISGKVTDYTGRTVEATGTVSRSYSPNVTPNSTTWSKGITEIKASATVSFGSWQLTQGIGTSNTAVVYINLGLGTYSYNFAAGIVSAGDVYAKGVEDGKKEAPGTFNPSLLTVSDSSSGEEGFSGTISQSLSYTNPGSETATVVTRDIGVSLSLGEWNLTTYKRNGYVNLGSGSSAQEIFHFEMDDGGIYVKGFNAAKSIYTMDPGKISLVNCVSTIDGSIDVNYKYDDSAHSVVKTGSILHIPVSGAFDEYPSNSFDSNHQKEIYTRISVNGTECSRIGPHIIDASSEYTAGYNKGWDDGKTHIVSSLSETQSDNSITIVPSAKFTDSAGHNHTISGTSKSYSLSVGLQENEGSSITITATLSGGNSTVASTSLTTAATKAYNAGKAYIKNHSTMAFVPSVSGNQVTIEATAKVGTGATAETVCTANTYFTAGDIAGGTSWAYINNLYRTSVSYAVSASLQDVITKSKEVTISFSEIASNISLETIITGSSESTSCTVDTTVKHNNVSTQITSSTTLGAAVTFDSEPDEFGFVKIYGKIKNSNNVVVAQSSNSINVNDYINQGRSMGYEYKLSLTPVAIVDSGTSPTYRIYKTYNSTEEIGNWGYEDVSANFLLNYGNWLEDRDGRWYYSAECLVTDDSNHTMGRQGIVIYGDDPWTDGFNAGRGEGTFNPDLLDLQYKYNENSGTGFSVTVQQYYNDVLVPHSLGNVSGYINLNISEWDDHKKTISVLVKHDNTILARASGLVDASSLVFNPELFAVQGTPIASDSSSGTIAIKGKYNGVVYENTQNNVIVELDQYVSETETWTADHKRRCHATIKNNGTTVARHYFDVPGSDLYDSARRSLSAAQLVTMTLTIDGDENSDTASLYAKIFSAIGPEAENQRQTLIFTPGFSATQITNRLAYNVTSKVFCNGVIAAHTEEFDASGLITGAQNSSFTSTANSFSITPKVLTGGGYAVYTGSTTTFTVSLVGGSLRSNRYLPETLTIGSSVGTFTKEYEIDLNGYKPKGSDHTISSTISKSGNSGIKVKATSVFIQGGFNFTSNKSDSTIVSIGAVSPVWSADNRSCTVSCTMSCGSVNVTRSTTINISEKINAVDVRSVSQGSWAADGNDYTAPLTITLSNGKVLNGTYKASNGASLRNTVSFNDPSYGDWYVHGGSLRVPITFTLNNGKSSTETVSVSPNFSIKDYTISGTARDAAVSLVSQCTFGQALTIENTDTTNCKDIYQTGWDNGKNSVSASVNTYGIHTDSAGIQVQIGRKYNYQEAYTFVHWVNLTDFSLPTSCSEDDDTLSIVTTLKHDGTDISSVTASSLVTISTSGVFMIHKTTATAKVYTPDGNEYSISTLVDATSEYNAGVTAGESKFTRAVKLSRKTGYEENARGDYYILPTSADTADIGMEVTGRYRFKAAASRRKITANDVGEYAFFSTYRYNDVSLCDFDNSYHYYTKGYSTYYNGGGGQRVSTGYFYQQDDSSGTQYYTKNN